MNIDQVTWNILFERITGTRCFIPEGCAPPVTGILVYLIVLSPFILSFYIFFKRKLRPKIGELWKRSS